MATTRRPSALEAVADLGPLAPGAAAPPPPAAPPSMAAAGAATLGTPFASGTPSAGARLREQDVSRDEEGLRQLALAGAWRAVASLAQALLKSSHPVDVLLRLRWYRVVALLKVPRARAGRTRTRTRPRTRTRTRARSRTRTRARTRTRTR